MKRIQVDYTNTLCSLSEDVIESRLEAAVSVYEKIITSQSDDSEEVLGWMNIELMANEDLVASIESKAKEIREKADVFLLIGVGGSNQGARAVIEALGDSKVKVIYTGNNLSPAYLNKVLKEIEGKSVYANIIAKNFTTLEPGICFRVIRQTMEEVYGEAEAGRRIIATGSPGGSSLELLAKEKGYMFLPFPLDVGGRFSVLSAVGLLPIAVSGVNIRELLMGAKVMKAYTEDTLAEDNSVIQYAVIRNMLRECHKTIEIMGAFEPAMTYFQKWWLQLFGESEGKDGRGIFPAICSFSEDLHALGQYIQSGEPIVFESFLAIEQAIDQLMIKGDRTIDHFDYLNGKDFAALNQAAFEATVKAHFEGGVPSLTIRVPKLDAYYFGQLFYFFEMGCYLSATMLGVNPFNQPGVEAYKNNMFGKLKQS